MAMSVAKRADYLIGDRIESRIDAPTLILAVSVQQEVARARAFVKTIGARNRCVLGHRIVFNEAIKVDLDELLTATTKFVEDQLLKRSFMQLALGL